MDENRNLNRTWLCSVLFLDIVNYSSQSVAIQMEWKAFFNESLSDAIAAVSPSDRVILDTGDGAAVCFLGDPEAGMLSALAMRSDFASREIETEAPRVRIGLNLGPVKLVKDINGNLNAIGDGINVGQRIMSFALPNQILVSRSYYEVVSTLSDDYRKLFRFGGSREDKHVREHVVYELTQPGSKNPAPEPPEVQATPPPPPAPASPSVAASFDPATLKAIEQSLMAYLGPIAPVLVQRESRNTADLQTLCQNLAASISKTAEREAFLKSCRSLIPALGPSTSNSQEPVPVQPQPAPSKRVWDEQLLAALRKDAAGYLGPIASIVVDRAATRTNSAEELREAIAGEIHNEAERKAFLRRNR